MLYVVRVKGAHYSVIVVQFRLVCVASLGLGGRATAGREDGSFPFLDLVAAVVNQPYVVYFLPFVVLAPTTVHR